MARERYLVGVDLEELKKTPTPQGPKTPREKWENFWYHYKWWVIGIAVTVLVIGVPLVQSLTRVKEDYLIMMVTTQEVGTVASGRLEALLEQYATDVNGDGEVKVIVRALNISTGDEDVRNPLADQNLAAVTAELSVRDADIWAVAPSYYNKQLTSVFEGDPSKFFLPLDDMAALDGVSEKRDYWNWKDIAILSTDKDLDLMQEDLYWGVRGIPENASEEEAARLRDAAKLLKAFAEAQAE